MKDKTGFNEFTREEEGPRASDSRTQGPPQAEGAKGEGCPRLPELWLAVDRETSLPQNSGQQRGSGEIKYTHL